MRLRRAFVVAFEPAIRRRAVAVDFERADSVYSESALVGTGTIAFPSLDSSVISVEPGDFVDMGEPLFVVDQRAARARLSEANAGTHL